LQLSDLESAVLTALSMPYTTRHNLPKIELCLMIDERFWSKVERHPTECWEWRGHRDRGGYGSFSIDGKERIAHRVAWRETRGYIPDGLHVCHHCDNRGCVRPSHLFLGTRSDNMRDMVQKGRNRPPDNRGERHGLHKLTESAIQEIRSASGTQREIAERFGITQPTVSRIRRGLRWGHVATE
jgi:DNA-binding CsgD family transcriptional regulator